MKHRSNLNALKRIAAYGAIYLLWGGAYLAIRVLVVKVPPFLTAGVRYSLGSICLLLISLWRREPLPTRQQGVHAAWTGVFMLVVGFGAVFWAERQLASWIVAVVASTSTLWTYLGETLLVRARRFDRRFLAVLLVGLGGVWLGAGVMRGNSGGTWLATSAVVLGAACWTVGSLAMKHLAMPRSYLQSATIQLGFSGIVLLAISFVVGEWKDIPLWRELLVTKLVVAMAYLVFAASVVAFAAFHWLLKHEPASMVATCTYVNPAVAMLLGIAVAGEAYSEEQLVGTALTLLSVFAVWRLHAGARTTVMNPVPALQE